MESGWHHLKKNLLPPDIMTLPPTDALDYVLRATRLLGTFVAGHSCLHIIYSHFKFAVQSYGIDYTRFTKYCFRFLCLLTGPVVLTF
jgi:hypothetical protein